MATHREKERQKRRFVDARARAEKQESGFGPSAFSLPKGTTQFKFQKAGTYRLRILPYQISARDINHVYGDPGFLNYEYSYWVHARIGADEKAHCCLKETFRKACPVCEYITTLQDPWGADKDTRQALFSKQRQLFALWDLDGKDPQQVQVYETSYYSGAGQMSLGQYIDVLVKKNEKYRHFYLCEGETKYPKFLEVTVEQGKFRGSTTYNIKYVEMVDADPLPDEVVDRVPALDTLPVELTYKELKRLFEGGGAAKGKGAANGEAPPKILTRAAPREETEEEADEAEGGADVEVGAKVSHPKYGVCEVVKVLGDGSLSLEDGEGDIYRGIDPGDVELVGEGDEGVEEEAPVKAAAKGKVAKPGAKKSVQEDFEEEEEDLEEDSELEEEGEDDDD